MNLSILISTYERDDHFIRLLNYYTLIGFKGSLVIGEGSNIKTYQRKKKIVAKYKNLKIKYIHAPGLVFETLKLTIKFVKTKYIVFLGDDDYLVIKHIKKFLKFLDKNKSISGVHGDAIVAKVKNNFLFSNAKYSFIQNIKKKPFERIKFHIAVANYSVNLFAIQRTKNFLKMTKFCTNKKNRHKCPERSISEEFLPTSILAALGKYYCLNGLYLIRTVGHSRILQNNYFNGSKANISIRYLVKCSNLFVPKKKQKEVTDAIEQAFLNRTTNQINRDIKKDQFLSKFLNYIFFHLGNIFPNLVNFIYDIYTNSAGQKIRKYIKKYIF